MIPEWFRRMMGYPMAKMFYTANEAKTVLHCDDAALKQFCHTGQLREFRDGPRLMFKSDQVDLLAIETGLTQRTVNYQNGTIDGVGNILVKFDEAAMVGPDPETTGKMTDEEIANTAAELKEMLIKTNNLVARLRSNGVRVMARLSNSATPNNHERYVFDIEITRTVTY